MRVIITIYFSFLFFFFVLASCLFLVYVIHFWLVNETFKFIVRTETFAPSEQWSLLIFVPLIYQQHRLLDTVTNIIMIIIMASVLLIVSNVYSDRS